MLENTFTQVGFLHHKNKKNVYYFNGAETNVHLEMMNIH